MSAHTPGPWVWGEHYDGLNGSGLDDNEVLSSAPYEGMWVHYCERMDANARLIAAAPDLLAALIDLIELADNAMRQANSDGAEYDRDAELAPARAAIAKATGSTA